MQRYSMISGCARIKESHRRKEMIIDLRFIFEIFDDQKDQTQQQCNGQEEDQPLPVAQLRIVDRHRHRQAAENQHDRVGASERYIEKMATVRKASRIGCPIDRISQEQSAEKHDFGEEEEPHPDRSGLFLLLHRNEVMSQSLNV